MKKVLPAGITGYLGGYIAKELQKRAFDIRVIVRNSATLHEEGLFPNERIQAELTQPKNIQDCCRNIEVVISTIGKSLGKSMRICLSFKPLVFKIIFP